MVFEPVFLEMQLLIERVFERKLLFCCRALSAVSRLFLNASSGSVASVEPRAFFVELPLF